MLNTLFGEGAAISPSKLLLVLNGDGDCTDFAASEPLLSFSLSRFPSPKSGMGCRCRCPWWVSKAEGDLGDEDNNPLPLALLTLPRAVAICFGLLFELFPIAAGNATAVGVFSLENEFVRLGIVDLGGVAVLVFRVGIGEDLTGGGLGRPAGGGTPEILSSIALTSAGIAMLCATLTAFQSTTDMYLYSEG